MKNEHWSQGPLSYSRYFYFCIHQKSFKNIHDTTAATWANTGKVHEDHYLLVETMCHHTLSSNNI